MSNHALTRLVKENSKAIQKKSPRHEEKPKHSGKKHDGPKHKPEHADEVWRAYQHMQRGATLLALLPKGNATEELVRLLEFVREPFEDCQKHEDKKTIQPTAEAARALEHLCLAALQYGVKDSVDTVRLSPDAKEKIAGRLRKDVEKQHEHIESKIKNGEKTSGLNPRAFTLLSILAQHSIQTAQQMLQQEQWQVAHECLRAVDALTRAVETKHTQHE